MSDLVRRGTGGLITSDAGPSLDASTFTFVSNPLQQWWGIENLPQNIIIQFHNKSLFPAQIVMDELTPPEVKKGNIIVRGWIIGTLSFTNFQIAKLQSEPESSWRVQGNVVQFKSEAEVRKSLVSVDPASPCEEGNQGESKEQVERLGDAHVLPILLRRMLLSVSAPSYFYAEIWRYRPDFPASAGSFMRYQVPCVTRNATQLVAIHSEQRVDFGGGESELTAIRVLSAASWKTKVIRASIR